MAAIEETVERLKMGNLSRKKDRPMNQQLEVRRLIADLEVLKSEQKRADEALQQAYAELEQRIEARTAEL
ncbi:MAG: hypothetical protein PHX53_15665, partial [Syntrophales bacterium]|nr:hypothetical protein [Syntrophales bacterium]